MSPADYGVVAISGVFTGFLFIVTDMGFMSSLINMKEVDQEDYDSVFWLNILLSLGLFIILYLMAPVIAAFYRSDILVDVIRVSALVLPLRSLKIVPLAIALRGMNFKYRALVEMLGQFVTATSSIIMAYSGYGVWSLVLAVIIGQTVVAVAYLPLMKGVPKLIVNFDRIKNIVPYGMFITGSDMLGFITKRSDVMIIGLFLPEKVVGYYSMGFQLATMPLDKVGALFNRIAFPAISRAKDQTPFARSLFTNMHKYLLVIAYPILIGMALLAKDIVVLLLTEKWLPIVPIIQALCVLNLLRVSGMIMPFAISGLGFAKKTFNYALLSSIVLPLAFYVGAQFGLEGVLVSWFIAYPIFYVFLLFILLPKLKLPISKFLETFRTSVTCSIIMAVFLYSCKPYIKTGYDIVDLVLVILTGMTIYIASYYIFFRHELLKMRKRIKEIRNGKAIEESI